MGSARSRVPALASGGAAAFSVTVRALAPGEVTVLAEATSPISDPDLANNTAVAHVTIVARARATELPQAASRAS